MIKAYSICMKYFMLTSEYKIKDKFNRQIYFSKAMQMMVFSRNSILKNIPQKAVQQQGRFYPYKTQNFRFKDYRKNKVGAIKRLEDSRVEQENNSRVTQLKREEHGQKANPKKDKQTLINETKLHSPFLKAKQSMVQTLQSQKKIRVPFIREKQTKSSDHRRSDIKITQNLSLINQSKLVSPMVSGRKQVPNQVQNNLSSYQATMTLNFTQSQSPELKPYYKESPQPKQTIFRQTFCTSLNKQSRNHSLEMKLLEKRPPTSQVDTQRPVTRIRKVSNIGDEANGNFLAKYEILKELGKGTYGTVYLAKIISKKNNGKILANEKAFFSETVAGVKQNQLQKKQTEKFSLNVKEDTAATKNSQNIESKSEHRNQENLSNVIMKGNVDENQLTNEQQLVAIKVYQKFKMNKDPSKFKNIRKQITIMQNLAHSGVIKLYESVESLTKISLVVQYGGDMSLLDYLRKNFPLTQDKLKDFSKQLLQIVRYLHDKNIVHRDIKPQNILVRVEKNGEQVLKLIDYGFSTLTNKARKLNVICGTPNFMAPQLLSSKQYFGEKADVWSYGVVVFVMAEGRHPFKSTQIQQLERLVNRGKYAFKRKHQPIFEHFISQILRVNSSDRPTATQISTFKWLQQQ